MWLKVIQQVKIMVRWPMVTKNKCEVSPKFARLKVSQQVKIMVPKGLPEQVSPKFART